MPPHSIVISPRTLSETICTQSHSAHLIWSLKWCSTLCKQDCTKNDTNKSMESVHWRGKNALINREKYIIRKHLAITSQITTYKKFKSARGVV
jgi:hypothetical protein